MLVLLSVVWRVGSEVVETGLVSGLEEAGEVLSHLSHECSPHSSTVKSSLKLPQ